MRRLLRNAGKQGAGSFDTECVKADLESGDVTSVRNIGNEGKSVAIEDARGLEGFPGGELGALVRDLDWSATSLGDPAGWPQSLQTVVRVMLASRFAMWMGWGPELTFLYNDAYARMTLGKKHPWALGKPSREVWAEIWDDIGPRIQRVLDTGEATWDEALLLFLERSGYREETYHTFSYSPLTGEDGRIAGHLCVVSEETDRVIGQRRLTTLTSLSAELSTTYAEQDVMAAIQRSLQTNSRDLPFALTYLFDGKDHARLGATTGIEPGHPAAPAILANDGAWPLGEVVARNAPVQIDHLQSLFGPLPTGAWDQSPARALLVPIASQAQDRPAGVFIAALNPYRPLDSAYSGFVELIAGQIAGSLANARAYEQEKKRAESLAELDRAKTTFFSNVSHEFRTPLTLMLGPLEEVLAKPEMQVLTDNRRLVGVAHRNGTRLLKLVNSLLDFSRTEVGRVKAVYRPMDLATFTRDLASSFESLTKKAGLDLQVGCKRLTRPVYIDRDMWEKIVLNLLSNAFKFTFDGKIAVSLRECGEHVELNIMDTGVGIPEAELPRVFERFHRVEGARGRSFEGSGIGLALVHELVKLHGGTIAVDSVVGRGTTFRIHIPFGSEHLPQDRVFHAALESALASPASPYVTEALSWLGAESHIESEIQFSHEPVQTSPVDHASSRKTVLVVDDNPDMREYIARLLRGRFHVITAENGRLAWEVLERVHPGIVLTDIMMPEMDGLELLAAIRGNPTMCTTPVILLSARAGDEARVEGIELGADDYLVKPFNAHELVARVRTHIELARLRKEAIDAIRQSEERVKADLEGMRLLHELGVECARAGGGFAACLHRIVQTAISITAADKGNLQLFDPRIGVLKLAAKQNFDAAFEKYFAEVKGLDAACARVLRSHNRVVVEDITQSEIFGGNRSFDALLAAGVRAVQSTPLVSTSGEVLGMISTHFAQPHRPEERELRLLDLLARQAADYIERKQAEEALRLRTAQFEALLDNAPLGVYLVDSEFRIRQLNPIAVPIFDGIPDLIGRDFGEVMHRLWTREYADEVVQIFRHTLATGEPYHTPERAEYRIDRQLKEYYEWRVDRIPLPEGGFGVVCYFRDISKQVQARVALEEQEERLRKTEKMAAAGQLAASLAHEINNPLSSVTNALYLLNGDPSLNAQARSLAETASNELARVSRIVKQSLSYYRIGTVPRPFDLAAIVEESLQIYAEKFQRGSIQLIRKIVPGVMVIGFADEVRQVIDNLLLNAVEATPRGGRLAVSVHPSYNWVTRQKGVRLTIADSGTGIPRNVLPRVFEPFFTTKAEKGTGLGLWVVRGIVAKHDGSIAIRSSEGECSGTAISIFWPATKHASRAASQSHSSSFSIESRR